MSLLLAIAGTVQLASSQTQAPAENRNVEERFQLLEKKLEQLEKRVDQATQGLGVTTAVPGTTDRFDALEQKLRILEQTSPVRDSSPTAAFLPAAYNQTQAKPVVPEAKPAVPTIIPAVAPGRALRLEPAKPGGLIPDIKLGSGARMKLYGFLKASTIYDTSSPTGVDYPVNGFQGATADSPNGSSEFHLKARSSRFGANFEWPDISPKLALTGRLELDLEGNFATSSNTIRGYQPRIRLAWGRLDYKATDKTSLFALFGQDWTPFGSSTQPTILEGSSSWTGYGNLYQRDIGFRAGLDHNFGKFHVAPEFGIYYPGMSLTPPRTATGNLFVQQNGSTAGVSVVAGPGSIGQQLQYGERLGADSQKPEIQGRLVFQWQLDPAKGVAPAQIIFSGFKGSLTSTLPVGYLPCDSGQLIAVRGGSVNNCPAALGNAAGNASATLAKQFRQGVTVDADAYGFTGEVQLPTRYVTAIAKYYRGANLAFFVSQGQGYTTYSNTNAVLGGVAADIVSAQNIDGSNTLKFISTSTIPAVGSWAVVPQNPVRGQGGIAQLGFPLSRIFNADPAGRNAGWTLYTEVGYDSAFAKDVLKASTSSSNLRNKSYVSAATLQYKLNQFVTFGLEESYFGSAALTHVPNYGTVQPGTSYTTPVTSINGITVPNTLGVAGGAVYRGNFAAKWHDLRTEFATIFTF